MKTILFMFVLSLAFISCSENKAPMAQESTKAQALKTEDCDDKIEDLGKKDVAEVSLDAPTDEGCTLE